MTKTMPRPLFDTLITLTALPEVAGEQPLRLLTTRQAAVHSSWVTAYAFVSKYVQTEFAEADRGDVVAWFEWEHSEAESPAPHACEESKVVLITRRVNKTFAKTEADPSKAALEASDDSFEIIVTEERFVPGGWFSRGTSNGRPIASIVCESVSSLMSPMKVESYVKRRGVGAVSKVAASECSVVADKPLPIPATSESSGDAAPATPPPPPPPPLPKTNPVPVAVIEDFVQ